MLCVSVCVVICVVVMYWLVLSHIVLSCGVCICIVVLRV